MAHRLLGFMLTHSLALGEILLSSMCGSSVTQNFPEKKKKKKDPPFLARAVCGLAFVTLSATAMGDN